MRALLLAALCPLALAAPPLESCLSPGQSLPALASFSAAGHATLEFCLADLLSRPIASPTLPHPAAALQLHVSKPATAPCALTLALLWRARGGAGGGGAPPGARPPAPAAPPPTAPAQPLVLLQGEAGEERLALPLAALLGHARNGTLHARVDCQRSDKAFARGYLPAHFTHVPFALRLDTLGWGGLPDALLVGTLLPLLQAVLGRAGTAALGLATALALRHISGLGAQAAVQNQQLN